MSESQIQAQIMRGIGRLPNVRIFRNQVGVGWLGKVVEEDRQRRIVVLSNAYRVTMGLTVGSSDLIGWRKRVIKPGDVGKSFAQFLGVEAKTESGTVTPEQHTWIRNVNEWGGIAIVARSAEDAISILKP